MKTDKVYFNRSTIAQYIGTVLFIVLLESHVVSRPIAFLLGPWIICLCLLIAALSDFRTKWRRLLLIAGTASALGYLITRCLFS